MCEPFIPIDPEESILRRVHVNEYKVELPIPIQAGAFRPSPEDGDGLSFFREKEISAEALARSGRKDAKEYVVARYRAADLVGLGLSLVPTRDAGDLPGHVVIPELNQQQYKLNKVKCKEIHLMLAKLGSRDVLSGFI